MEAEVHTKRCCQPTKQRCCYITEGLRCITVLSSSAERTPQQALNKRLRKEKAAAAAIKFDLFSVKQIFLFFIILVKVNPLCFHIQLPLLQYSPTQLLQFYFSFIIPLATGFGLSDQHQANFKLKNIKCYSFEMLKCALHKLYLQLWDHIYNIYCI